MADSPPQPQFLTCRHNMTLLKHVHHPTLQQNQNPHYTHLLRVLHATPTHPGQGQRPVCGEVHTSQNHAMYCASTHTHTHSYSCHLLVLHNTCHCLPIHQQICTTLSLRQRRIARVHTLQQYNNSFTNSLPGRLISDMRTGPLGC